MYKISKDHGYVMLLCHDCAHVERVDAFNENSGNRRTQAARAMQNHSRDKHGAGISAQARREALGRDGAVVGFGWLPSSSSE
jgi:hypothetical protein